jgi:hypothetical protein
MIKEILSFLLGLVLGTWKGEIIIDWIIKFIGGLI